MKREHGDAVITGASGAAQLEENLTNLEKGPLPEEMVKAFHEDWAVNDWIIPQEVEQHQAHIPNDYFIPQRSMTQSIAIYWGLV